MGNKPKHTCSYPKDPDHTTEKDMLSAEDKQLFRQAIGNITPQSTAHLPPHQRYQHKKSPPRDHTLDQRDKTTQRQPTIALTDHNTLAPVTGSAIIQYHQPAISAKIWRSLRTGKIPVNATLDLHGFYVAQAREKITTFLQAAYARRWQCIHIIHGRGHSTATAHPVLKNQVNHWLRQHPYVLAFHSCPNNMGGAGAVLVLVKKQKSS